MVLVVLLVALVGACSGGDKGAAGGGDPATPGAAPTGAPGPYSFTVTGREVHPMAPEAPLFPEDVSEAVTAGLNTWLGTGVVEPFRSGKPPLGLDAVFTEPALARIAVPGPERAAMVEEGAPLTGRVVQDRANARLTVVTAPDGAAAFVTVQIDVSHAVTVDGAAVDVVRAGELVLVPDRGSWRIDAFDVVTKRDTRPR